MVTLKQSPEDFIVNERMKLTLDGGKYAIFSLIKQDINTMQAIDYIKKSCNIKEKDIGYAGIKDKVAITTQYISILGQKEKVLHKEFPFKLTYLGQSNQPLYIGGLEGNDFIITIRDCTKKPVKKKYIINYFGEQRFSEHNSQIGRLLVKKKYERAVEKIMDTQNSFQRKKIQEILDKDSRDFISALRNIPPRLLQFYVHAYQSYVWNKVISELVKTKDPHYTIDDVLQVAIPSKNITLPPIPLIGFYTDEDVPEEAEQVLEMILDEEELTPRDFINKSMPELSMTGNMRDSIIEMDDIDIITIDKSTYKLSFFLPKGSYATVMIRQLVIF